MTRQTFLKLVALPIVAAAALWSGCTHDKTNTPAAAAQESFATPEDAVVALIDTARKGNVDLLVPILGPRIADLEAETKDRTNGDLQRLAVGYDRQHALMQEQDGSITLIVGLNGWEFPAPLVKSDGRWHFDTEAGAAEVQRRRIIRNEEDSLQFCIDCIVSQREFYAMSTARGEKSPAYAATFVSTPGKRDGLYWDDNLGDPRSPLGELAAEAYETGKLKRGETGQPYLGYRYRVLTRQGAAAPGGAKSYLDANGRLTGGFAFLAFPADYGTSGVMTFMVAADGTAYEKDLGPATDDLARAIESFDPAGWDKAQAD